MLASSHPQMQNTETIWYSSFSLFPIHARQAHPCPPHRPPMTPAPRPKQCRPARQRRLPRLNSNLPLHLVSPRTSYPWAMSSSHTLKAWRGTHTWPVVEATNFPCSRQGARSWRPVPRCDASIARAGGGAFFALFCCSSEVRHALIWSSLLSCSIAS